MLTLLSVSFACQVLNIMMEMIDNVYILIMYMIGYYTVKVIYTTAK